MVVVAIRILGATECRQVSEDSEEEAMVGSTRSVATAPTEVAVVVAVVAVDLPRPASLLSFLEVVAATAS